MTVPPPKMGRNQYNRKLYKYICCSFQKLKHSIRHTRSIHKQVEEEIHKLNKVLLQEKTLFDTFINLSEIPVKNRR